MEKQRFIVEVDDDNDKLCIPSNKHPAVIVKEEAAFLGREALSKRRKRESKWTHQEDKALLRMIAELGPGKVRIPWIDIGNRMNRDMSACCERWEKKLLLFHANFKKYIQAHNIQRGTPEWSNLWTISNEDRKKYRLTPFNVEFTEEAMERISVTFETLRKGGGVKNVANINNATNNIDVRTSSNSALLCDTPSLPISLTLSLAPPGTTSRGVDDALRHGVNIVANVNNATSNIDVETSSNSAPLCDTPSRPLSLTLSLAPPGST